MRLGVHARVMTGRLDAVFLSRIVVFEGVGTIVAAGLRLRERTVAPGIPAKWWGLGQQSIPTDVRQRVDPKVEGIPHLAPEIVLPDSLEDHEMSQHIIVRFGWPAPLLSVIPALRRRSAHNTLYFASMTSSLAWTSGGLPRALRSRICR